MVQPIFQGPTAPRSGPTIGCVVTITGLTGHAIQGVFALEIVKRLSIYEHRPIEYVNQIEVA